ncbi:hypothetical protein B0T13DRAFT_451839 [Neurospora crassa]|nr:hypothetical protein B0T13DRAFT_451839 [Neurospora crassa]
MMLLSADPKQQTARCAEQRLGLAAGKEEEKQKGKKVTILPVTCTNNFDVCHNEVLDGLPLSTDVVVVIPRSRHSESGEGLERLAKVAELGTRASGESPVVTGIVQMGHVVEGRFAAAGSAPQLWYPGHLQDPCIFSDPIVRRVGGHPFHSLGHVVEDMRTWSQVSSSKLLHLQEEAPPYQLASTCWCEVTEERLEEREKVQSRRLVGQQKDSDEKWGTTGQLQPTSPQLTIHRLKLLADASILPCIISIGRHGWNRGTSNAKTDAEIQEPMYDILQHHTGSPHLAQTRGDGLYHITKSEPAWLST